MKNIYCGIKYHLKNCIDGAKTDYETTVMFIKENNYLHADFVSKNSILYSYSNVYNDKLYNGCVVELFINLDKLSNKYHEYQIAPNSQKYFAHITNNSTQTERLLDISFLDIPFIGSSHICEANTYKSRITIDLNNYKDALKNKLYLNAFRCEGKNNQYTYLSLSKTGKENFHIVDSFICLNI